MGKRARVGGVLLRRWKGMLAYLVAGMMASLVVSIAFAEVHERMSHEWLRRWDRAAQGWVHARSSAGLTPWMEGLSAVGGPVIAVGICLVVAAVLWWMRRRRGALVLGNSMAGATLLDLSLKVHYRRLRPDVPWSLVTEHSYSFPSGHSVAAVVMYGTLLYLLMRWLDAWWARIAAAVVALGMALGIGYSRVYLGAHWPSDVLAGYFCGAVWLVAVVGADMMVRRELPKWVETAVRR